MVVILSCNVQRGANKQIAALEVGADRKVDVIVIQEPRIRTGCQTPTMDGYTIFEPFHTWNANMKTISYVRNEIKAIPIPRDSPDGLMTTIHLPEHDLDIHNIYRPTRSNDQSWLHQTIFGITNPRTVITGDFNRIGLQDHQDTEMLDFLHDNFPILNALDIPSRGDALLDLACSRIQGATAYVDPEADVGSDHLPLMIWIPDARKHKTHTSQKRKTRTFDKRTLQASKEGDEPTFLKKYKELEKRRKHKPKDNLDLADMIRDTIEACSTVHTANTNQPRHPF